VCKKRSKPSSNLPATLAAEPPVLPPKAPDNKLVVGRVTSEGVQVEHKGRKYLKVLI